MEQIKGIVENIVFQAPENTFCVLRLTEERQGSVCVVYKGMAPYIGEQIELSGVWIQHPKFGRQFQAKSMKSSPPCGNDSVERFLASGIIRGVGKVMAARIVAYFGEDTLNVMNTDGQRLTEVAGIGRKKAKEILESYAEVAEMRELMIFLETYGLSSSYAMKLQANYGAGAIDKLKENPYDMASEVRGIGFKTADRIALALGLEKNSPQRLRAGIEYAITKISAMGHTCVDLHTLATQTADLLQIEQATIQTLLDELIYSKRLRTEECYDTQLVYPEYLYQAECIVARRLLKLRDQARPVDAVDVQKVIERWQKQENIELADVQVQAIESAVSHGVLVLTGGPGTGKTTIIKGIIKALEESGCEILLAAPTGRAARRLADSTGREAKTIHRMLEYKPAEGISNFGRNEYESLQADVVIVDEASMLDILLSNYLLRALPTGCRLVLVGDVDQLPAVGAGNVLNDIIRSGSMPVIRLTRVFRQHDQSSIVINAHKINSGQMPVLNEDADFAFIDIDDEQQVANAIASQYIAKMKEYNQAEMQVLAPMHKQVCGVQNLNKLLQEKVNPESDDKHEIVTFKYLFREGDKVMQIKNNYDKDVFNGDIGIIGSIDGSNVHVDYPERLGAVVYEKSELDELELAYAISVHKSQGSEYKYVLLAMVMGHYIMLQRNLLYTAITRAKKEVSIMGHLKALRAAIGNNKTNKRYSLLKERLKGELSC